LQRPWRQRKQMGLCGGDDGGGGGGDDGGGGGDGFLK
jgi:hypothetical protein